MYRFKVFKTVASKFGTLRKVRNITYFGQRDVFRRIGKNNVLAQKVVSNIFTGLKCNRYQDF